MPENAEKYFYGPTGIHIYERQNVISSLSPTKPLPQGTHQDRLNEAVLMSTMEALSNKGNKR